MSESEWRDIASAPKDGTPVLLANARDGSIRWSLWSEDRWRDGQKRVGGQVNMDSPTHWMPLPAPPTPPLRAAPRPESERETAA